MTDDDIPPPDSKLTRSKQAWARAGKFLTVNAGQGERLPPGQHLVRDWPVLDLGVQPMLPEIRWSLDIVGAVAHPQHWKLPDFYKQPQTDVRCDMHCVTTWSRYDNDFSGLSSRDLAALAQPTAEAGFVILHSFDGYTTNLTLEAFLEDDVLLAQAWNGAPLTREHGGPVRLIAPRWYLWKSAKWLKKVEFSPVDKPGFWETRGYHNHADPWLEERYS